MSHNQEIQRLDDLAVRAISLAEAQDLAARADRLRERYAPRYRPSVFMPVLRN